MKKKPNDGEVADMGKAVEGRWTLKDQVTPAIQRMNKETLKYKATMNEARKSMSEDWAKLKEGALFAGAAEAIAGFSIIEFAKSAVDAAKEQIDAETKLSAVLHNVKGVTDSQVESLKNYSDALQDVGVVGHEVQLSGVQQLGTFQLQAATIKMLMPGMADLVAQQKGLNATQQDSVNIGNVVGKAMAGNVGALKRYGISFTDAQSKALKFGNEQQKAAVLAAVLKNNVGGVNAALAATDQGKIKQASNAFEDMKQVLGTTILLIEGKFAGFFMKNLPEMRIGVQKISDGIAKWASNGGVEGIINGMKRTWSAIKSVGNEVNVVYGFFKNNWSLLGPIVYTVAGALVAYKIATVSANVATLLFGKTSALAAIKTSVMGIASLVAAGELGIMGAAQQGLNAAMKANPIGVVITLLGLLVLAGMYVVKNWQTVKLAMMETWNVVVGAAQWAVNKFIDFSNFMIRIFKFAWDSIKFAGIAIWDAVIDSAQGAVQKLLAPINAVRKALGKDAIKVDFSAAKGVAVKPVWDSSFNAIPQMNFGGAKFGQDAIMTQTSKAQAERDKNNAAHTKALNDNTEALAGNTKVTGDNTDGMSGLDGTLQNGLAVNLTGEQIADKLVPRLERHLYGT